MTFKDFLKKLEKRRKKNKLPQTDKTPLVTSSSMTPTAQLPAAGANQPRLS